MKTLLTLPIRIITKPFRWLGGVIGRRTAPVPVGLWLVNVFMQRVMRLNGTVPSMVHFTSRCDPNVKLGRNVWKSMALSGGCYIQAVNGVEIGDDTLIAPGVKIVSANHDPADFSKWLPAAPIRIGKHCWLAANAVILPGVELGDEVVVGAGAVVTKSVPAHCVVAGVPARIVRQNDASH